MSLMHEEKMEIHRKTLELVQQYKRLESDLLKALQQVDQHRIFLQFQCRSLFDYATRELGLSESVALNFIAVARKAREVPELHRTIESGALSVSKARKITSILNSENQRELLSLAITLPQKKLEQHVAKLSPKSATPERLTYVTEDRLNFQLGISEALHKKLRRAQDVQSQRLQRAATLEQTIESALDVYLSKYDPISIVARRKSHRKLPVARQVQVRDGHQCTFVHTRTGERCTERRWLDVHHIKPRQMGGDDALDNLTTLCSGHHRLMHSN